MTLALPEALLGEMVRSPAGVPEARITAQFGSEVGPALATLVERGHRISTEGSSLQLGCAPQHFDPTLFHPRGRFGNRLEIWEVVDSTNDLARSGAASGTDSGSVWLAEEQRAGRGRQGRTWACAPHQGLLFSVYIAGSIDRGSNPTLLPIALGLGVCEALRAVVARPVRTKWPNDVLLFDRKLGGLLVEALPDRGVVAGVGLNILRGAIDGLDLPQAIALGDVAPHPRREILLAAVLAGLERRSIDWRAGRHAEILAAYVEQETTLGRTIRARIGESILEGKVRGVTESGGLRLETAPGIEQVLVAGEVHLL